MHSKYIIPAICAAQGVVAASHHRHLHHAKKDVYTDVVVVTEVVYQTVYGDEQPTPTPEVVTPQAVVVPSSSSVYVAPTTMVTKVATPAAAAPASSSSSSSSSSSAQQVVQAVASVASSSPAASATATYKATGSKRGLAYNTNSLIASAVAAATGKFSWAYNWGSTAGGALAPGITFIPTCWGPAKCPNWGSDAQKAIDAGSPALFSFNEPDVPTQLNMDAGTAASEHARLMAPFKGKALIGAPSICSADPAQPANANMGINWLNKFLALVDSSLVDFCNAHWYGPGGSAGADQFLAHLVAVNKACGGKPVWVTEFQATSGDVDAFIARALDQLDNNPTYNFVTNYAYFFLDDMVKTNELKAYSA